MSSVSEVIKAFDLLYVALRDSEFRKSMDFKRWSERDLLVAVRTFLLGYFGPKMKPEVSTSLPGKSSGFGRVDFMVYGIAVELAVRRSWCPKSGILPKINADEMRKLMRHDGRGVLILYDFSKDELSLQDLQRYRTEIPSLGKGNHKVPPFSVAYFSMNSEVKRLDIRVS